MANPEYIYTATMDFGTFATLAKVLVKKETLGKFTFDWDQVELIIGDRPPDFLFGRSMHKNQCYWYRNAQDALCRLQFLARESLIEKEQLVKKAQDELELVCQFELEEQDND